MKTKITAIALGLVLLGAGCTGANNTDVNEDNGAQANAEAWDLTFVLPEDWVVVQDYEEGYELPSAEDVTADLTDVVLQSTSKNILTKGDYADDMELSEEEVESTTYTRIQVYRYSLRKSLPDEAEDLGDGFYKLRVCEAGVDCSPESRAEYDYYYKTDSNLFQFVTHYSNMSFDTALDVIMSAQSAARSE